MAKNTHSHDWEKRVAVIMQELESRQEGVAKSKVLNEIKNLIAGLSLQNIELAGKGTEEVNKNVNEGLGESHQPWGPIAKLEFPKFSGEGLESWLLHTEYFFGVINVANTDRRLVCLRTPDKELSTYAMRVREWYGWHFPELAKIIQDNILYSKAVKLMGSRDNAIKLDFSEAGF
ncbi:hypothetical protein GH714_003493 [Hevea brasiliensis]|uniref:NOSIC domain-containing protein n=1 Tax=Hevea brasiliensis TaxID=3981 RepID=A0A6A6M8C0_HEVBR|nr:hypothetical protein GH714_003493 [Hevea brasiliensis]